MVPTFYDIVENLNLTYPIAEIGKSTGFNKGYISSVLSKKRNPSKAFLKKFYEVYVDKSVDLDTDLPAYRKKLQEENAANNDVDTSVQEVGELLGEHEERIIKIEGLLQAMLPHLAASISKDKVELVLNFQLIQQQAAEFSNMIFDERKRKHKP